MKSLKQRLPLAKAVSAVLAIAVLAGAFAPGLSAPVAAKKGARTRLAQDFSTSGPIAFSNGGGQPQSLPSTITASGFEREVVDVDITFNGLSFAKQDNFDILLVSPGGQSALVLSDVGTSANNVTLTLDDQATNQLSPESALPSGTFQPRNVGDFADGFFPPAPQSPQTGNHLSAFNGTNPNGAWTLYVRHDPGGAAPGVISGSWSLKITSANGVPIALSDTFSASAGQTMQSQIGVLANDSDPDNEQLTAILASPAKKGEVQLLPDGTFIYRPGKKAKGSDSFTYLAQDPGGLNDLAEVTIQVKGKKHKKGKR